MYPNGRMVFIIPFENATFSNMDWVYTIECDTSKSQLGIKRICAASP